MRRTVKFKPPHAGEVTGKEIRSRFTTDGSYAQDLPRVRTVGELKEVLAQLPDALPLNGANPQDWDEEDDEGGYSLVWFNVGSHSEHLAFDEERWDDDGDFDDEED